MNSKLYRCGWCGFPTNEVGTCMTSTECLEKANKLVNMEGISSHTHCTNGDCCMNEILQEEQESRMITVTRDMALDACIPELEGQRIPW